MKMACRCMVHFWSEKKKTQAWRGGGCWRGPFDCFYSPPNL
jgi:hypothetical protein